MKKLLGHYTNLSALESILQKIELIFGSFNQTNDPYENRNLEFTIWGEEDFYDSSLFIAEGQLRKPFKLLCFSISNEIEFFYKRPRMWSQYANNHHGCCLILDKDKFDKKFKSLKVDKSIKSKSPVAYTLDKSERGISQLCRALSYLLKEKDSDLKKITDFLFEARKLFLYSKMQDWEQENEYRYCIYTEYNHDIFIDITSSLSEIILGEKVSPLYRKMLYKWGEEKNIKVSYIWWENGFPNKTLLNTDYYKTIDDIEKNKIKVLIPQIPNGKNKKGQH